MSTYDPTLVKTVYEFFVGNYCSITSNVFYIYDCLLTLDDEVEFFWKRPFTGATALFLFNRYLALADVLTLFFSWSGQNAWYSDAAAWYNNDRSCAIDERITLAIVYLQLLPPAVFSCLRAFALSKSWPLAMLVLVLALVPYGVNMADYGYNVTGVPDSIFGCALSDTEPMHISIIFTILSRTCLIVQDAILLIITWARLYRRHVFGGILRRLTFESVLLQDGTLYFIVLLALNILHISLSLASFSTDPGYSDVATFTPLVTSMLISRFLLDLQKAKHSSHNLHGDQSTLNSGSRSEVGSVSFASRVVGSLDETLSITIWNERPEAEPSDSIELIPVDS